MQREAFTHRLTAQRQHWLVRDGAALMLFTALGLLAMYPVLASPRSTILGWPGDNIQFVYVTGWIARALARGLSPFVDPHLNYPGALAMTATDVPFAEMIAVSPVTWLFGPVFGYNAIILTGHVLTGYVTYRWILSVTSSRAAAAIAGTAFLLSPFRVHHSYGHLMLVATFVVPLFFWALDRAIRHGDARRRLSGLIAATALVGLTSQYMLVICLVTGAIYAVVLLVSAHDRDLRRTPLVAGCVVAGALAGASPYLLTLGDRVYAPYDVETTRIWSTEPGRFLTPSPLHPIWGRGPGQEPAPAWIEKTVYVGFIPLGLALVALFGATSRAGRAAWTVTAVAGAVVALGTDLHFNNRPLNETDPVYLPAYYLSRVPLLDLVRVWSRFGLVSIFFVALLAGVGAATLADKLPRLRRFLLPLLGLLIVIELLPGALDRTSVEPRQVDRWLASREGDFAVAFLPADDDILNYRNMFGSLLHGKRLPAHNHPVHRPAEFVDFARRAAGFPHPRSVEALRALGLRYVLVQRASFDGVNTPDWETVRQQLGATPGVGIEGEVEGFLIVRLEPR